MLETLLGQIKGVLGKSFLLAGLLPSALLFLTGNWYAEGGLALTRLVRGLLAEPAATAEEAVFTALLLLGGGLVFFACRGPVLRLFQSVGWKALTPLHDWALKRQWGKWNRLRREIEERELQMSAFLWAEKGFGMYRQHSPVRMPTVQEAVQASERARRVVTALLAPYSLHGPMLLGDEHERAIIGGLSQLYVVATEVYRANDSPPDDEPPEAAAPSPADDPASPPHALADEEVGRWRSLLDQAAARAVLNRAKAAVPRRWAKALGEFRNSYPQREQWLRPTALGNRMAALDDYAEHRYRISTSTLWTRLAGILPKESRAEVADAQLSVEVLTNLAFGALAFGSSILAYSLWVTFLTLRANCRTAWAAVADFGSPQIYCPPTVFFNLRAAAAVALSALLCFVFYRGAVYAFSTVAEKMVRMIDLHRLQLIAALGYKFPQTIGEEMNILEELQGFFAQAIARDELRPLAAPPPKKEAKDDEEKGAS